MPSIVPSMEKRSEPGGRRAGGTAAAFWSRAALRVCRQGALPTEPGLAVARWPSGRAAPSRSARRSTARAPTSRCSPRSRSASSSVCSTTDGDGDLRRAAGADGVLLARLPAAASGRASATAFACTGRGQPADGQRCNPPKLLLDPYARAIDGRGRSWNEAVFPVLASAIPSGRRSTSDSAPFVPRSRRGRSVLRLGRPTARRDTPLHETVIYEVHVKGFTDARIPTFPPELRGTYAGLAHPAAIEYLQRLGVTAVELLPVHQFVHDGHLVERGLRNYWGYNSIGFFAPHDEYAADRRPRRRRCASSSRWCRALHARRHRGDPRRRLQPHRRGQSPRADALASRASTTPPTTGSVADDRRYYMDYTGTGNSLNMRHPHVLQLIMDSLRYWVQEMHVDGFRFDLAADAGARAPRRRSAVGVLRSHPAGPGRSAG